MMKVDIAFLLPLTIVTILCFSCNSSNPRFEISVKEVVRCQDSGTDEVRFSSTRLTKVGRYTYDYITNYTTSITLDDSLSITTELQAWGNGGWRPAFTHDSPHFCAGLKQMVPPWFQELIKHTGKDDCPIPPGTYKVTAHNISFVEFQNVPMWSYRKYRLINRIYKEDVLVGCLGMTLDVDRKMRHSKKEN